MNRQLSSTVCLVLLLTLSIFPLWGKTHRFQLVDKANLFGVDLEAGDYKLQLSEDVAMIYRGKRLLVTAKIRTESMRGETPHSCRCLDGKLTEVRLDSEKVVFLERLSNP